MSITQRRIINHDSFVDATASPRDTAAIYFHKQLDPFYDVALAVAMDFFNRPELYTRVVLAGDGRPAADGGGDAAGEAAKAGPNVVQTLARLRARCGADEFLPSRSQRTEIYTPVFGPPLESASFDKLRDDLIDAATAFSERVFDTGEDMLRERVRTAHRPLRDYLLGVTGDSTDWSARNALEGIAEDSAYSILRDSRVCAVFGIITPPSQSWPYIEDSNGDKLIEEITCKLDPVNQIARHEASSRQRLAQRGAEAIAAVIDYTENSDNIEDDKASLAVLITQCYTWGAAKKALGKVRVA